MNKRIVISLLLTLMVSMSSAAFWQDTKFELHRGYGYLNPFSEKDYNAFVFSFAHANGWAYGDNFFWFDATKIDDEKSAGVYGEFAPRLSFFKIFKAESEEWLLKDLSLAGQLEMGGGGSSFNYLVGIGTALKIPAFAFFNLNGYLRDNPNIDGITFQVSSSWKLPFKISNVGFVFDGFFDIAGKEGGDDLNSSEANFISQPALLLDIGNFWKKPEHLYLGTEVEIWANKYGVKDQNDVVPQITLRWRF